MRRSEEEIREMYQNHMNESEIAAELGVSRQSMYDYRVRHGIAYDTKRARKRRYETVYGERDHRIVEAHLAGKDIDQLCEMFEMKPPAINYILVKYKAKRPIARKSTSRNQEILCLYEQGVSVDEIAEKYELNKFYVHNLLCAMRRVQKKVAVR